LKDSFCDFAGKGPNWLDDLQRNFGVVTAVVQVFEPSQVSVDLKIPAFVGPESYGKSTLINHIVSKGRYVEFMPASPGMGTQVVCKISKGLHESFQMASDSGPQSGSVKDRLAKVNEEMIKKQQKGMLGIKDMDILRAEKNFESPVPMEFLDVPGIKPSTAFHTSLALGLATTVVLVCGSPQSLETQLKNGDLALLTNIVRDLEAPIPIQAAVSYRVTAAEFGRTKAMYVHILTSFFPTCEIKEPLWMNFFVMSEADKERTVEQFLEQAATGSTTIVDPYARFFKLQDQVEEFTKTFHKFLRQELKDYFQVKMPKSSATGTGAMKEVWDNLVKTQTDTNAAKQLLSEQMSGNGIQETLERVVLQDELEKVVVNVSGKPVSEVENVVLIAQGLLIECRLCEMAWLIKQAKELHQSGFGDMFKPLCQKINAANVVPIFNLRVSEAYAMFGTQLAEDADEEHDKYIVNDETHEEKLNMRWWTKECCSKVAPYLGPTAFAWFLTGFYLVSGDSKNKNDFLKLLRKPTTKEGADPWRKHMLDRLSEIPYGTWVKEVKAAGSDQNTMFRALFDSMEKACKQFAKIAKESGTLTVATNFAMTELLELVFVMTERIFAKQSTLNPSDFEFTKFADHLKQYDTNQTQFDEVHERIGTADPDEVAKVCTEALLLMKARQGKVQKWESKLADMQTQLDEMQRLGSMCSAPFTQASTDSGILLVPNEVRAMFAKPEGFWVSSEDGKTPAETAWQELDKATVMLHNEAPPTDDANAFPAFALDKIQRIGFSIAVYMRRLDTASFDPLDKERALLTKLRGQPNFVKLFVLWTPPSTSADIEGVWSKKSKDNWNDQKSGLDVELIALDERFDCQTFLDDKVKVAIQESKSKGDENMRKLREELQQMKHKFARELKAFSDEQQMAKNINALDFHNFMRKDVRSTKEEKVKSMKSSKVNFRIPKGAPLKETPEFLSATIDQVTDAATNERQSTFSVNELSCRAFLFNVMLGQCVGMARGLAGNAHDVVITSFLNRVGEKYFMSGEQILKEMDLYLKKASASAASKTDNLELQYMQILRQMLTKDCFEHMYVGCVTYMLMPALYSTVLAVVHDQDTMGSSDKNYRHNLLRAKSMLGDKASYRFWLEHMAEKKYAGAREKAKIFSPF